MPKHHRLLGLLVAALTIVPATSAFAAPATITLRIEGKTRTLFEGQVTTDVRTFKFSNDPTEHECDATSNANGGSSATPVATAGGALATASEATPFSMTGTWYEGFGPAFSTIDGDSTAYDGGTNSYLAEYYNDAPESLGACAQPIKDGDSYLFAYGTGNEQRLKLAGPATAKPGEAITVKATDASDGAPVAGVAVGGQTTGSDGTALIPAPAQRGVTAVKGTKSGDIRSNRVSVCVTDGADGFCGTVKPGETTSSTPAPAAAPAAAPDTVAAFAKIGTIAEGKRFAKGRGPRTLAGRVDPDAAGVKDVRLRLSRTDGRACSRYDGARERFVTTSRCGVKNARTFSAGSASDFSYLLPAKLPRGRYVLDVIVIDRAGNQTTTYQRGRNRVVFFVA